MFAVQSSGIKKPGRCRAHFCGLLSDHATECCLHF
nr:MAG TPA: hypothetical protein [Caudoviricetes sp.]